MAPTSQQDVEAALDALADTRELGTVVCVGDVISTDAQEGFLRGHGTQAAGEGLRATQCGLVQTVNKLVSVQPLQQRYAAELGDVVVGRVSEIVQKRWKLDLQSRQEASIQLSAVNLPGGVQRRRTTEDELGMREVFKEGEVICAEVQSLYQDGSVALQTRSAKYGKLQDGILLSVASSLVPRQRKHFCPLENTGVRVVLGVNGMIWIGKDESESPPQEDKSQMQSRTAVVRVANAIRVLAKLTFPITPVRILAIYQESLKRNIEISDIFSQDFVVSVIKMETRQSMAGDG